VRVLVRIGKAIDAALFEPEAAAKADAACSLILWLAAIALAWVILR